MSGNWGDRGIGSAGGAALGSLRVRTVKRRLREATVPSLSEGEEILVATYARSGRPVYLFCEFVAAAVLLIALFAGLEPLIYTSGGAIALFAALTIVTWKWLGLVLTDRRLILSRAAPITQRLRGLLIDVPRSKVGEQRFGQGSGWVTLVLRFDDPVGHAPIRLTFLGNYLPDGSALHKALTGSALGEARPLDATTIRRRRIAIVLIGVGVLVAYILSVIMRKS